MISQRKKCYIAFSVERQVSIPERTMQIRHVTVKRLSVTAPETRVYVRFTRGLIDAVVLAFNHTAPTQTCDTYYQRAEEWLARGARHEILDTHQEAA